MIALPSNFESYNEARKNGFLKMKELKDAGQRIVGTFCSFVPTELVEAAGGTVVSLCASSEEPIPALRETSPEISVL
jgi:benzoyl-CoA reductase/2-hydroxyglutaryl-CoA dehydratase subunit BcrC/BadD/HgdB